MPQESNSQNQVSDIMYAEIKYSDSTNLGDMVQTIAASQHLPRIDKYVERNFLKTLSLEKTHLLIMQSWFPY